MSAIIGGISGIFGSIFTMLVTIGNVIARALVSLGKWFFSLMTEKPEAGLTLITLGIYLMS
mgnify:CR=1 FL=1